jgi:hypothetical protein
MKGDINKNIMRYITTIWPTYFFLAPTITLKDSFMFSILNSDTNSGNSTHLPVAAFLGVPHKTEFSRD